MVSSAASSSFRAEHLSRARPMATAAVALPSHAGVGGVGAPLASPSRPTRPTRARRPPTAPPAARAAPTTSSAAALATAVAGGRAAAHTWTLSLMALTAAAVTLGAAPWTGAPLFVLFALTALPHRALSFISKRWGFFLADFCYAANVLVLGVVVAAAARDTTTISRVERVAAALADGPLSGALLAWQCAYGPSLDHSVSVLVHVLPGLALFARKWHTSVPASIPAPLATLARGGGPPPPPVTLMDAITDGVLLPMVFYGAWQLFYFIFVHLAYGRFIVTHRYDTSYRALARRTAAVHSVWGCIVRRGSPTRRIVVYGALQAAFTAGWLVAVLPATAASIYPLSLAWQAIKVALPLYYGALHSLDRAPRRAAARALAADGRWMEKKT